MTGMGCSIKIKINNTCQKRKKKGCIMNNFEKRLTLNYLDKMLPCLNYDSWKVGEFFATFFRTNKLSSMEILGCSASKISREIHTRGINLDIFIKKMQKVVHNLKKDTKTILSPIERKFLILKDLYNLNEKEYEYLVYFTMQKLNRNIRFLFTSIECDLDSFCENYLDLGANYYYFMNNLMDKSVVKLKGYSDEWRINPSIISAIVNSKCPSRKEIEKLILGASEKSQLKLKNYEHIQNEAATAIDILKNAVKEKRKGVNILLYGAPGTGKTEFAKLIANISDIPIYNVIAENEKKEAADREERLLDLRSKQYILSTHEKGCILFDEAEDAMNTGFSPFYRSASKSYLNRLLENSLVPVIWTTNDIEYVDSAFLRRMTYTIEFKKLTNKMRFDIWDKELKKNNLKINKPIVEKLSKTYDISPSIITNAIQTTKMIGGDEEKFSELIESVATVVLKKKNIKNSDNFESENYDISLVNADLDMNNLTEKIIQSNKLNFSLCLYGEPGTGKSEYAKYLADKLGIEAIYKKASDLISMWVGETEKNIAEAFCEAKEKKAMLIFDEADSFLQNRSNAQRSWEVTQVNEMLTWMESHQYPFICTTNLINSLDEASLRRFTFKVKFDFMKPEQVNRAIEHFFGIKNSSIAINGLTTGDFAVVKKKVVFLGTTDIDEITQMLNDEVKVKKSPNLKNAVGF